MITNKKESFDGKCLIEGNEMLSNNIDVQRTSCHSLFAENMAAIS
jgi:hypothetical protein